VLFDHELSLLNEVNQKYCGTGKAVNTGDEDFIFTKCRRGYGGVAILWSKCIDPLVKVFKEGNSRIQCIELNTNIPILRKCPIVLIFLQLKDKKLTSFVSTASALSIFTTCTFFCGVLDLSIKKADSSELMDDTFYCCLRVEKLHVREEDLFDIGC
jgi:hypothetical protein